MSSTDATCVYMKLVTI